MNSRWQGIGKFVKKIEEIGNVIASVRESVGLLLSGFAV